MINVSCLFYTIFGSFSFYHCCVISLLYSMLVHHYVWVKNDSNFVLCDLFICLRKFVWLIDSLMSDIKKLGIFII